MDRTNDVEQHPTGDTTPRTILQPRLAFEAFFAFDLALAQGTCQETRAVGFPPLTGTGEGKAPQDGLIFIEHNDLPTASLVLEGGKCKRTIREVSGVGIEPSGGAAGASRVFFHTPRTRSRPRWTPVCWAKTVASSRQLPWEERAPCSRGS